MNRLRRLRLNKNVRSLVRENHIRKDAFIYPVFIDENVKDKTPISSMPGQYVYPLENIASEIEKFIKIGIKNYILFGVPREKDEYAFEAYNDNGIVQRTVRELKKNFGSDILLITDVCMCQYTSHGHCGIIKNGEHIDNDETLVYLAKIALSHAICGSDMIAPSDMMDGRIKAIRDILDKNGFQNIPIMSYSAKYQSAFYGPFRDAAHSAPAFGDRATYQMDIHNRIEALREMETDILEGADIIMVKPAMPYLDIISDAKRNFIVPIAAYQVSGEYAMIMAACENGWIDKQKVIYESVVSIFRAGADILITYFTPDIMEML